jgi:hypothetical protein
LHGVASLSASITIGVLQWAIIKECKLWKFWQLTVQNEIVKFLKRLTVLHNGLPVD